MRKQKVGAAAVGLSLLVLWACTEVHVRLSNRTGAQVQEPDHPSMRETITLAELVDRQNKRKGGQFTSFCSDPGKLKDEVRPYNQEASNWCWATSAQMVLEFHKEIKEQCNWVNGALARGDCCNPPHYFDNFLNRWLIAAPPACNRTGWPDKVFSSSGFDSEQLSAPGMPSMNDWTAYFAALETQLCQNGPFISVIQWAKGGKHTQVVSGINKTEQVVEVSNHLEMDSSTQTFDEFIGDDPDDVLAEYGHSQLLFYVEIRRQQPQS